MISNTMSTNSTIEHHQADERLPASRAFYRGSSHWSQARTRTRSIDSDSSASTEYLDVSTPEKSDDSDVPDRVDDAGRSDAWMNTRADGRPSDSGSHIIPIDSPTTDPFPRPPVPHPDADLDELQRDLTAVIIYTLHVEEKQPLADAEAQASSYVAKFIADFESQASTSLNAAGHLYSCSEERLIEICSDNNPEPPRIVRRICFVIHSTLLYSEYGKVCLPLTPLSLSCQSSKILSVVVG